ncbi:MAG: response regulator [Pyrinomonadaceae bacterium]
MINVLYVDDDASGLAAFRNVLTLIRPGWKVFTARNAASAMEVLEGNDIDAVATSMYMPGVRNERLLREIRELYPQVARIMVAGHESASEVLETLGDAHQYLPKPMQAVHLVEAVEHATALKTLLRNERVRAAVGHLDTIPSMPAVYKKFVDEVNRSEPSVKKLGEIIGNDIGLTAKILQIANSAFFGFQKGVTNPVEAVRMLGVDTVKSLTLAIGVFSQFQGKNKNIGYINHIWNHSLRGATMAKHIAELEAPELAEDAFSAGLLHDIGEVVMAFNAPKQFAITRNFDACEGDLQMEAERHVFGANHSELGAYLLGLWGLPQMIVEAVAFSHNPSNCSTPGFSAVTAVHAADAFTCVSEYEPGGELEKILDMKHLERVGVVDRVEHWFETCAHDSLQLV